MPLSAGLHSIVDGRTKKLPDYAASTAAKTQAQTPTSRKSRKWSLCDFVEKRARPQGTICRFRNVDFSERMSPARDVIARSLLRLLELGAMASSALASEAVCLDASRILAGRDRGDERQNHNDDPGHRCRLSVHENVGDLGKKAERNPGL